MFIAGLNLSVSSPQVLNALGAFSTFGFFRHLGCWMKKAAIQAESKGGHIRAETMPIPGWIRFISKIHGDACFIPYKIFIGILVLNRFRQPAWIAHFALPDGIAGVQLDPTWKVVMRVGACIAGLALRSALDATLQHLGEQWHYLGRRERPRVVQTGPYAWIRHPMYSVILLQDALCAIMFWSYLPLVALGAFGTATVVKIPIEEAIILQDDGIREEYGDYMKKVPARIIPYVW